VLTERAVIAVSGGVDSMLLATLAAEQCPERIAAIATFDHGSGPAATDAVERVVAWARERALPVTVGRGVRPRRPTEAAWRDARWAFLRGVSASAAAPVATAHTRDDQIETVMIRLLRGSGVRGLAGLLAPSPVIRPLVSATRRWVMEQAEAYGVRFAEDPTNDDRRFLRNRIRRELLPAVEAVDPGFRDWLWELGVRAARWRADVACLVDSAWHPKTDRARGVAYVPHGRLTVGHEEAALMWPEVAGRIGVALDRRGTERLAMFTTTRGSGREIPLSGGVRVRRERSGLTMRRPVVGGIELYPDQLAGTTKGALAL
jgi:tRNA(Ile)-lysidine synthase